MENPFEASGQLAKKETVKTSFEKAAEGIKDGGFYFHAQEHDEEGRDPKTFHVSGHPRTMEKRAKPMAETLGLSVKQRAVTEMDIAWHDTVIEYDKADPNNLLARIQRHRGAREGDKPKGAEGNEGKSAQLLEQKMREANKAAGEEIFTEEEIQTARWGIDATYPDVKLGDDFKGFEFEKYEYFETAVSQNQDLGSLLNELKTQGITKGPLFFQPHLEKPLEEGQKIPKEVLIVALSDLGAAGSADKEEFFKEGDDEMRELYANLRNSETLRQLIEGDGDAARADREKVSAAFLGWLDSQQGFATWQALRFEKIMHLLKQQNGITPEEEQGLRAQFSKFIENIRATRDRARDTRAKFEEMKSDDDEKAAFAHLARTLHYEV